MTEATAGALEDQGIHVIGGECSFVCVVQSTVEVHFEKFNSQMKFIYIPLAEKSQILHQMGFNN